MRSIVILLVFTAFANANNNDSSWVGSLLCEVGLPGGSPSLLLQQFSPGRASALATGLRCALLAATPGAFNAVIKNAAVRYASGDPPLATAWDDGRPGFVSGAVPAFAVSMRLDYVWNAADVTVANAETLTPRECVTAGWALSQRVNGRRAGSEGSVSVGGSPPPPLSVFVVRAAPPANETLTTFELAARGGAATRASALARALALMPDAAADALTAFGSVWALAVAVSNATEWGINSVNSTLNMAQALALSEAFGVSLTAGNTSRLAALYFPDAPPPSIGACTARAVLALGIAPGPRPIRTPRVAALAPLWPRALAATLATFFTVGAVVMFVVCTIRRHAADAAAVADAAVLRSAAAREKLAAMAPASAANRMHGPSRPSGAAAWANLHGGAPAVSLDTVRADIECGGEALMNDAPPVRERTVRSAQPQKSKIRVEIRGGCALPPGGTLDLDLACASSAAVLALRLPQPQRLGSSLEVTTTLTIPTRRITDRVRRLLVARRAIDLDWGADL